MKATVLAESSCYFFNFYQTLSASAMSAEMSQIGVALFPTFFLSFYLSRFSFYIKKITGAYLNSSSLFNNKFPLFCPIKCFTYQNILFNSILRGRHVSRQTCQRTGVNSQALKRGLNCIGSFLRNTRRVGEWKIQDIAGFSH